MPYIHGRNDGCIGFEVADGVEADLAPGSKTITFDDLGHFMQLEDPTLLNRTIVDFLTV
jgi:pimeloyl-ACP methyl ester carboxylesterase